MSFGEKKKKKKTLVFNVAILCVWVRAGWWSLWCVGGGSVGVLMRFVWSSLGVGMDVLCWGRVYLGVWVCEWVFDKWHRLYANIHFKHECA